MNIIVLDNLASKPRTKPLTTIVWHHTAGSSAESTIAHLKKVGLSYHYIIERDGTIYRTVDYDRIAYHAGKSFGPSGSDVNGTSIGIAFANLGTGEKYPEVQINAAKELANALCDGALLDDTLKNLKWHTTHRLITSRKIDPAYFDFLEFSKGIPLEKWMDVLLKRSWNG